MSRFAGKRDFYNANTQSQRQRYLRSPVWNSRDPDILDYEPIVDILMSSSLYQIVMLPSGDVVLQRADNTTEQLVRIIFSDEVKSFLGATSIEIAKAMIDAGIDAVENLGVNGQVEDDEDGNEHSLTLH